MKGRMFCASQASTAICSSMDHIPKPTTTTLVVDDEKLSDRAIDRHNPIIKDGRRSSVDDYIRIPASPAGGEISNKTIEIYKGRRSVTARKSTGGGGAAALLKLITNDLSLARKSFSCVARPSSDFVKTPAGSTRYLLGSDPGSLTGSAGQDTVAPKSPAVEEIKQSMEEKTSGGGSDQVVVLKVSLHCRGCEAKVRKHLSRMQGVTSFNIDFAAKKVTVTGDITPLGILDSISKVKNAQFWTAPTLPTPTLPMPNLETPNPYFTFYSLISLSCCKVNSKISNFTAPTYFSLEPLGRFHYETTTPLLYAVIFMMLKHIITCLHFSQMFFFLHNS